MTNLIKYRDQAIAFVQGQGGRRFSTASLAATIGCTPRWAGKVLNMLQEAGVVYRIPDFAASWGWVGGRLDGTPDASSELSTGTLAALVDAAVTRPTKGDSPSRRGRVGRNARPQPGRCTPSQAKDARMALRTAERVLALRSSDPIPRHLVATDKAGRWAMVNVVLAGYQPRSRVSAIGSKQNAGAYKIASALGLVLDLAQHAGMLGDATRSQLPIAWIEWCTPTRPERRRDRVNRRSVALIAWGAGYVSPESADWARIGRILRDGANEANHSHHYRNAITAFRALGMGDNLPPPPARRLPTLRVSARAIDAAIHDDWMLWYQEFGGRHWEPIVGGTGGLSQWIQWMRTTSPMTLKELGLPPKEAMELPGRQFAIPRESVHDRPLAEVTISHRLAVVSHFLGAVEAHRGSGDADTSLLPQTPQDVVTSEWLKARAKLATRSLQAAALEQLAGWVRFQARCQLQRGGVDDAEVLLEQARLLRAEARKLAAPPRPRAKGVVQAYGGSKQSWHKFGEFRDVLIAKLESKNHASIEEQLRAVRHGPVHWRTSRWAEAVRDIVLISVILRVPLRSRTASLLEIAPTSDQAAVSDKAFLVSRNPQCPWEGPLRLVCGEETMKSKREFSAWLIAPDSVGQEAAERLLRRDLLELYLHPNGARNFLATTAPTTPTRLWLTTSGAPLKSPSATITRNLEAYGHLVGIQVDALRKIGGRGLHSLRHLFGTYHVHQRNHLKAASLMLGHADIAITDRLYCGAEAIDINIDEI